jgi:hypothetical protein
MTDRIKTYIINLRKRIDRKLHILSQFNNRPEFDIEIIEAKEHIVGAFGLWLTIKDILVSDEILKFEEIIICEDDHVFSGSYSWEFFVENLREGKERGADILSGGVSWFTTALSAKKNLLWVELFSGCQFTVIFKRFFQRIRDLEFDMTDVFDYKISLISSNKYFIYPFISTQKDFGYSDVTPRNNMKNRVETLFTESEKRAKLIVYLCDYYRRNIQSASSQIDPDYFDKLAISTYVINSPERREKLQHIRQQFEGRPEFDIKIVESGQQDAGAFGLWQSFREIASKAIETDDDVIIVCEDDHEFTEHYSKDKLIRNIFEAYHYRVEVLLGGISGFEIGIPVSNDKFWIESFKSAQFVILFRNIFRKILDFKYDGNITVDGALSVISNYKMTMFPFISRKWMYGNFDINKYNVGVEDVLKRFISTADRLELVQRMYFKLRPDAFNEGSQISISGRSLEQLLTDVLGNESTYIDYGNIKVQAEKKDAFAIKHPEHKINVLILFHDCPQFVRDCYESLIGQEYQKFKLYFLNDNSNDTDHSIIPLADNVVVCKSKYRKYALANLIYFLRSKSFDDDEIIILVEGDDFLLTNDVFSRINHIYHEKKCFLTYGQYCYTDGRLGHCSAYSTDDFNNFKKLDWRVSHLVTFKYKIFKEFLNQDPNVNSCRDRHGAFYEASYEVALMKPLMEIAGYERIYFNKDPVYACRVYTSDDSKTNLELKIMTTREILAKESFLPMSGKLVNL